MINCVHCIEPLKEISRNQYFVFYKCGCNRNKGVKWDWRNALIDGEEYQLGTADSFVHECPICKRFTYRQKISNEKCLWGCGVRIEPLKWINK